MSKQFTYLLATALSLITLGACSSGHSFPVPEPMEEDNAYVNLRISIVANNSVAQGRSGSRADGDDDRTATLFSPGIKPYEHINSLRVIMTDESNTVEYNEIIRGPEGTSAEYVNNITMRTTPGGKRLLYLIANEQVLPSIMIDNPTDLSSIAPGSTLPDGFDKITIGTTTPGSPLFSNGTTYVPMTEIFEVKIPEEEDIKVFPFTQYADLFVTRAAVKFSFIVLTSRTIPSQGDASSAETGNHASSVKLGEDYKISKIEIHDLAGKEYLFPTGTFYYPQKYSEASQREITGFETPDNTATSSCLFTLDDAAYDNKNFTTLGADDPTYDILKQGDRIFTYSPTSYFPETRLKENGKFSMDVTIDWLDGTEDTEALQDIELQGLRAGMLPRNTHVLVILTMGEHSLSATATLVPYIGVELEPEFGFNFICPATKDEAGTETTE